MNPNSALVVPVGANLARHDGPPQAWRTAGESPLASLWNELAAGLDLLQDGLNGPPAAGDHWLHPLQALRARAAREAAREPDGALYHLIHAAGSVDRRYSSRHGLLCFVIVREVAASLRLDETVAASLELAALTMNVSMRDLQDDLALTDAAPTPTMRAQIARHAERSAAMLRAAGVLDALWLEIVRLHHDGSRSERPLQALSPPQQAARLLKRVDMFAAKLSRRGTRPPLSAVRAAREACLGPGRVPDEIGAALLGTIGLYPPGSTVRLLNGEVGLVVRRGLRANLPVVAVLIEPDGSRSAVPRLRDAQHYHHAVKSSRIAAMPIEAPPYEWLLARATLGFGADGADGAA